MTSQHLSPSLMSWWTPWLAGYFRASWVAPYAHNADCCHMYCLDHDRFTASTCRLRGTSNSVQDCGSYSTSRAFSHCLRHQAKHVIHCAAQPLWRPADDLNVLLQEETNFCKKQNVVHSLKIFEGQSVNHCSNSLLRTMAFEWLEVSYILF